MKLLWTLPALKDRRAIRDYIARDNPAAAVALDALISKKSSSLIKHPSLGRPGRVAGTRELVVHAQYILVYDVLENDVRLLRVMHSAMQWP